MQIAHREHPLPTHMWPIELIRWKIEGWSVETVPFADVITR